VKRLADQTLYEILEVPPDTAGADIEAAYERARTIYGPGSIVAYTLMTPEEASLLTSRIEEAHRTLLDPDARSRYDASLSPEAAETRAAATGTGGTPANGTAAPAFGGLPPVIPAVQPPGAPSASDPDAPRAPIRLAQPVAAAPAAAEEAAAAPAPDKGAASAPIRLDREVKPAAAPEPPLPPAAAPAAATAPAEVPMPEGAVWTGEAIRRVREARGLTVAQIAERTKVTRYHVENIEGDRFGALPAPVYLRGIVLSIARELRLDGQKVARSYVERALAAAGGAPAGGPKPR
jgi:hypothetical protein